MHYYEKNIVDIKMEYTTFLVNILTPVVYEGIKILYDKSIDVEKDFIEKCKTNPDVKPPGVLRIFQSFLKGVKNLNNNSIEAETDRIRTETKCPWFDELVRAVVKSYIILLTFNASGKKCKLVNDKFHEKIDIKTFVHKCYIECARMFFNYPELFWHGFPTIEIKRNQRESCEIIKVAIIDAIRKMLPVKMILDEYLKNDYIGDLNVEENSKLMSVLIDENDDTNQILESDTDNIKRIADKIDKIDKPDENGMVNLSEVLATGVTGVSGIKHESVFGQKQELEPTKPDIIAQNVAKLGDVEAKTKIKTEEEYNQNLNKPGIIKSPMLGGKNKKLTLKDVLPNKKDEKNNFFDNIIN